MTEKPRITLPPRGTGVKFVQLDVNEKPYFRSGKNSSDTHSIILEDFLKEFGLNFKLIPSRVQEGVLIPRPKGDNYDATGMGNLAHLNNGIYIARNSFSQDYRLYLNEEDLNKISKYLPKGKEFELI